MHHLSPHRHRRGTHEVNLNRSCSIARRAQRVGAALELAVLVSVATGRAVSLRGCGHSRAVASWAGPTWPSRSWPGSRLSG